jgi:hypothetical protein
MKYYLIIFLNVLLISSCTYNKTEIKPLSICNGTVASYTNNIAPLIKAKCSTGLGPGTGCHDSWILEYGGIKGAAKNGKLQSVINNRTMPVIPNNFGITALTQNEIDLIACWLEHNYPEN